MTRSARHEAETRKAVERCLRALELREGGMIYRHIGDVFGVGAVRARQLVKRGGLIMAQRARVGAKDSDG